MDRIEVEAVGPSRRAHLDECPREVILRLQWLDHRSTFGKAIRKIAHALAAVGETKPQTLAVERPQTQHVNHRSSIRLHRGQLSSQAVGAHAHAANYPAIRRFAPEPIVGPSAWQSEVVRRK